MAFDTWLVGPQGTSSDNTTVSARSGKQQDLIVSELHGRFYEQTYRGNVFSTGMSISTISNATFTIATTGVTCTPILGVWNPAASPVNLVMLQAGLNVTQTALTNTGAGGFVWASSAGNSAISTGALPFNRKTLLAAGSQAKGFNASPALTGMTGVLATLFGSSLGGGSPYNISSVGTAVGFPPSESGTAVENFDGSVIVPPGAVFVLLATTTPVAHSASGFLSWEEVTV